MANKISMPVSIYALGGLCEVGKNTYCIENEKTLIIIDAGVLFPGSEYPGIDYLVPDYTHLKNNRNKIKALIITHGHEDHIGGIPFLIQQVNIPVIYAPRLAAALIKHRLDDYRLSSRVKVVEYNQDSVFPIDDFLVSFFRVTHSIPDAFGVCVDTTEGRIVTTGDFKIDLTPVGPGIELNKIARIGDEGVDLLLADSTNAEQEGYTPSEKNVYESINDVISHAPGRLIVSTFASNISRIQQICESAVLNNRKISIVGRSMENAVKIARDYGYIKIPDNSLIDISSIRTYKNSELVILCTGSQGEPMAALSRIASGDHKDVKIIPGDTVLFSSSAIPGNGVSIDNVVNQLAKCGADVITNAVLGDVHSSGHPSKQELRLMLKLVHPKYFMPAHGEYRMLTLHADIAEAMGIPKDNIFIMENGDSLTLLKHKITRGYQVPSGVTFIDGYDINGLPKAVIDDRKILTEDGMVSISIGIDAAKGELIFPAEIKTRGVVYEKHQGLMTGIKNEINEMVLRKLPSKPTYGEIKQEMKNIAIKRIFSRTNREPMIIPLIMTKY